MNTKKLFYLLIIIITLNGCLASTPIESNGETATQSEPVTLAAFNIQVLGRTKMGKPEVVDVLVDILTRYDIVLIQEIRDSSGTAIIKLLQAVNADANGAYDMVLGPRVGRSSSKEQYAFFYKRSVMKVLQTIDFDDGIEPDNDTFEREPFIVYADIKGLTIALIPIHTKPDAAVEEIHALVSVYDQVAGQLNDPDAIILGDLNADCSYVKASDWPAVGLKSDTRFEWLIDMAVDTTVKTTDCTYDHFVVTDTLLPNIQTGSAKVFDYGAAYGLTLDKADDVSDHFPIEMVLVP